MTDVEWIEREAKRVFSASVQQGYATVPRIGSPDDDVLGRPLYEVVLDDGALQLLQHGLLLRLGATAEPSRIRYANIGRLEGLDVRQLMRATSTGIATRVSLTLVLEDGAIELFMPLVTYTSLFSFLQPAVARLQGGA